MTREERENAIRCLKLWIEKEPYIQTYKTCLEALEQSMPTMVYPQVDGITPTVVAQADGDLISKDAVIEWLKDIDMIKTSGQEKNAREQLTKLPSVAIPSAEPKTGHWILKTEDWNKWTCSECGYTERTDIHVSLGYDFCPKCGAKMVEEQESEG